MSKENEGLPPLFDFFTHLCTDNLLSQTVVKKELFVIHAIYRQPTSLQLK